MLEVGAEAEEEEEVEEGDLGGIAGLDAIEAAVEVAMVTVVAGAHTHRRALHLVMMVRHLWQPQRDPLHLNEEGDVEGTTGTTKQVKDRLDCPQCGTDSERLPENKSASRLFWTR